MAQQRDLLHEGHGRPRRDRPRSGPASRFRSCPCSEPTRPSPWPRPVETGRAPEGGTSMQFNVILQYHDELLRGLWLTVQLSLASIVLGTALGIARGQRPADGRPAGAAGRSTSTSRSSATRRSSCSSSSSSSACRPSGLRIGATSAALIAMTINLGAYSTEIVRAGIESIHRSQIEAGEALGLTRLQIYRHVVLMPALAKVWPSLCSQFVLMMLASSVTSAISTAGARGGGGADRIADLPQLRDLHRGHPRLPGPGARPARPARGPGRLDVRAARAARPAALTAAPA